MPISPHALSSLTSALAGRYAIDREVGSGGMGSVYLADDVRHGRKVAVKVLHADIAYELGAERFLREIRISARLDHPHILMLIDSGEADGVLYYVMPFVDGESLRQRITRESRMPVGEALRLAAQVADALDYAHRQGVVHRDIKPENILIGNGHAKLADFGIALAAEPGGSRLTQTGISLGTPAYMSPEQFFGEGTLDGRSDLYSLACVVYEMLTGAAPFAAATAHASLARKVSEASPSVRVVREDVPAMVEMVLLRAMAKEPSERQATAGEFGQALLAEASSSTPSQSMPAVGAATSSRRPPIVGRESELIEAREYLGRLGTGKGGMLLIGGEPGVGKTRLSQAILDEARSQGALCLTGRCYEMEGTPAFTPFAEVLDYVGRLVAPSRFREALGDAAPDLARILPSLRELYPDIPEPLNLPPDQQRQRLFTKFREFGARAARIAPIVMLMDDVHWADDASLALLEHLAFHLAEMPLLVIGTYRDVDLDVSRPFARMLESLTRQRLAKRIPLRRLEESGVGALLASLGGSEPPAALVRVLHRETDGNPFFVEEVFQHLKEEEKLFAADGAWRTDLRVEDLDVPEGVRLVIGRRLERLGDSCRAVLTSAAVIGPHFSVAILEAADETAEAALLDALDLAVSAQILVEQRNAREASYAFSHELVRHTLLSGLSLPRRQRKHVKIADAFQRVYGDRVSQRAADVAYHLYQAGAASDPDRTVQFLVLSAEQALASAAFIEALEHCDRAATIESVSDRALAARLLRARGAALRGCGRWPDARAALDEAQRILEELGDTESMAMVAVGIGELIGWEGKWALGLSTMRATLERLPDARTPARAMVLSVLGAYTAAVECKLDEARAMFAEARSIGAEFGAPTLIGYAELGMEKAAFTLAHFDECITAGEQAITGLQAPGQRMHLVEAMSIRHLSLLYAGRLPTAESERREVVALSKDAGALMALVFCDIETQVSAFLRSGDAGAMEAWADDNLAAARNPSWALLSHHFGILAKHLAGRTAEALAATRRMLAHPTAIAATSGVFESIELMLLAELDDAEWSDRFAAHAHLIPDANRPTTMWRTQFALNLARALVRRGDYEKAAELLPLLRAANARGGRLMQVTLTERILGMVEAGVGNWPAAEVHLDSACRLGAAIGSPFACAESDHDFAWMLSRRRGQGDVATARARLSKSIETFRALRLTQPLAASEQLLASL